jgi:hypothetical protein
MHRVAVPVAVTVDIPVPAVYVCVRVCCLRGPPQDAKEPNLLKEISFSTLDVLEDFIDDFKDELTKQDVDLLVPVFNNLASSSPPFTLN